MNGSQVTPLVHIIAALLGMESASCQDLHECTAHYIGKNTMFHIDIYFIDLPQNDMLLLMQPIGRQLVKDCGGSPLAIRLLAPMLVGLPKEKQWKSLQGQFLSLVEHSSLRVSQ